MRRFLWLSFGALLLACIAVASSGGATQVQPRWVITDLRTLGGESEAFDINDRGQIVGRVETKLRDHGVYPIWRAVLWQDGRMVNLARKLPARMSSQAWAINERGQIVVRTDEADYLWEKGKLTKFGTPPRFRVSLHCAHHILNERGQIAGVSLTDDWRTAIWEKGRVAPVGSLGRPGSDCGYSGPMAINERGQIVGWSATNTRFSDDRCVEHAFVWQKGKMRDLGALPDDPATSDPHESLGIAINERGQIIGYGDAGDGSHAILWQGGTMTDLGTLGGTSSIATAINERGQVVGSADTNMRDEDHYLVLSHHAFLWENGTMRDLGPATGYGAATGVNERGQVVGYTIVGEDHLPRAVLWQNGAIIDLPSLPGTGEAQAEAINEKGQIIGWSKTKNDKRHAVLWTLKR